MPLFLQTLISGLAAGAVYGWLAVGLSVVFLASGILNFAGAASMTLSGYVYYWASPSLGVFGAALVALAAGFALGGISRIVARGEPWQGTLKSVGLFILLVGVIPAVWGSNAISPAGLVGSREFRISGTVLTGDEILLVGLFVLSGLVLGLILSKSVVGWTLRAAAESTSDVQRLGINAERLVLTCFVIAGMIWAMGGVLVIPITGFDPTTAGNFLGYGLTAMVIGGAVNPFAALIGGLLLGLVSAFSDSYISPLLGPTAAFVILIIALVARPNVTKYFVKGARLATQDAVRI